MPTVVRFISKVALFVLVMAVSGISATQAQTDPDPSLSSGDGFESYGNIIGYDDIEREEPNHPVVKNNTTWLLYEIEGYNNRFFVVAHSIAWTNRTGSSITSLEPYVRSKNSKSRLVRWEPTSFLSSSGRMTTTLNLGITLGGVTSGIQTQLEHTDSLFQPYALSGGRGGVDGEDWYSVRWMGDSGEGRTIGARFVTYWEGDIEDVDFGICGTYKTPTTGEGVWGDCVGDS